MWVSTWSWFRAEFQPVVLGFCQTFWHYKHRKVQPDFTTHSAITMQHRRRCIVGQKTSQHPKKIFEFPSRSLEICSWRLLKEITRKREIRLRWRIKMATPNIDYCQYSHIAFPLMFAHVSINRCIYLPFSWQNMKKSRAVFCTVLYVEHFYSIYFHYFLLQEFSSTWRVSVPVSACDVKFNTMCVCYCVMSSKSHLVPNTKAILLRQL